MVSWWQRKTEEAEETEEDRGRAQTLLQYHYYNSFFIHYPGKVVGEGMEAD